MKGYIEYRMPKEMMKDLLKKKKNKRQTDQEYLCEYVDKEIGVLGKTVKVVGF